MITREAIRELASHQSEAGCAVSFATISHPPLKTSRTAKRRSFSKT